MGWCKYFLLCLIFLSGCQTPYIYNPPNKIVLAEHVEIAFERYKLHDSPMVFAVTADGRYSYHTHCPHSVCQDDVWFTIEKCEAQSGKKCYVYGEYGKIIGSEKELSEPAFDKPYASFTMNDFSGSKLFSGKIYNPANAGEFSLSHTYMECVGSYNWKISLEVNLDCTQLKKGGFGSGSYKGINSSFSWSEGGSIDLRSKDSNIIEMKVFPHTSSALSKNVPDKLRTRREQNADVNYRKRDDNNLRHTPKPRLHKIEYPKNISKGVKITQVRDTDDKIEVLIVRDTHYTHFNIKGIEWSHKLTKRYFCEKYFKVLQSKPLLVHWKNPYNDFLTAVTMSDETCLEEGIKKVSDDSISFDSKIQVPLSVEWEGINKPLSGSLEYVNRDGGSILIQLDRGWVNCSGLWKYSRGSFDGIEGVAGVWSVACSNGITVTGDYTSKQMGVGKGIGTDSKGRKVSFRFGKSKLAQ